jgi:hypothetical protein
MKNRYETVISSPTGEVIAVDKRRLMEVPFFLLTNPTQNAVVVPANGSSGPVVCRVSDDGPAEVVALTGEFTGNFTMKMKVRDGMGDRELMNAPIHVQTIWGTNFAPYRLAESLLIDEQRGIDIEYFDQTGATNTIRMAAQAVRYLELMDDPKAERLRVRMRRRERLSYPMWYGFEGVGYAELAAGAAGNFPITILEDHFDLHTIAIWGTTSQDIDIQITDVTKGEPLIDAFDGDSYLLNVGLLGWTADYAYRLNEPRLFMGSSKLVVQLRNNGVATNRIYLALGGRALAHRMIKER